jgi:hypothetical protein
MKINVTYQIEKQPKCVTTSNLKKTNIFNVPNAQELMVGILTA